VTFSDVNPTSVQLDLGGLAIEGVRLGAAPEA
jgi:hypothetical protein